MSWRGSLLLVHVLLSQRTLHHELVQAWFLLYHLDWHLQRGVELVVNQVAVIVVFQQVQLIVDLLLLIYCETLCLGLFLILLFLVLLFLKRWTITLLFVLLKELVFECLLCRDPFERVWFEHPPDEILGIMGCFEDGKVAEVDVTLLVHLEYVFVVLAGE